MGGVGVEEAEAGTVLDKIIREGRYKLECY
jgi:hypothetical protein